MPKLQALTFALATALFTYAAAGQHGTAAAKEVRLACEAYNDASDEGHAEQLSAPAQEASNAPAWSAESTPLQCVPASACCRICTKGKACGDTCISSKKACRVGRGCACDTSKVCE